MPGSPWLAEEIARSDKGLCCKEFRRTPFLKIFSLSFDSFTEESGLYSQHRQKSFTAQRQNPLWGSPNLLSFEHREIFRRFQRPQREAEPHQHGWCYTIIPINIFQAHYLRKSMDYFFLKCTFMWLRLWVHSVWIFHLLNLQGTCLNFGIVYNMLIASNCVYIHLIIICYVIILGSLILNLFVHTHDDILYFKCLLYIYVFPQDGPRRPKHVGEIIMSKQMCMH